MDEEWILLFSSNATAEYILDVLETMAIPKGFVMHFRYQKRLVQQRLWEELPVKHETNKEFLKNRDVLILYLFQEKRDNQREWKRVYPIRFGRLIEGYKTGNSEHDIAHFYFQVKEYCPNADLDSFNQCILNPSSLKGANSDGSSRCFAAYHQPLNMETESSASDESAFQKIANSIDRDHFRSDDLLKTYYPVFYFIRGFGEAPRRKQRGFLRKSVASRIIKPPQAAGLPGRYEVTESKNYLFESSIYLLRLPHPDSKVELKCHEQQFAILPRQQVTIGSRYDELIWHLVPAPVDRDLHTAMILKTEIKPPDDFIKPLNLALTIPLTIKFDRKSRFVEIVRDSSFALATLFIAFFGLAEKIFGITESARLKGFGAAAVVLYALGVFAKIILQWKGK